MTAIDIDNVSFSYHDADGAYQALEDVTLHISSGEFICLIGHSGCGKSTLLSLLAGLAKPDSGTIKADGAPIEGPSVKRAMVFQHYSLFPWMRVAKNVAFSIQQSCKHKGEQISKSEVDARVNTYLSQVGMFDAAHKFPFQLSGGMRQRVAIARALAMQSDVLLLDEPFGALDARNRSELQRLLVELWQDAEQKRTVVFVTHDLNEALLLATRVVMMKPRRIDKVVDVDFPRPRVLDELTLDSRFRELRHELLETFYENETQSDSGNLESRARGRNAFGDPKNPDMPALCGDDDAQGILHYSDIQGGV